MKPPQRRRDLHSSGEEHSKAMAFAGTTQKCMACEKTVYLVEKLTADNRIYHKACFRCHHCKGTLKVNHWLFCPFCPWLVKEMKLRDWSCWSAFSSATTIPLRECFIAGHTLISSLRGLVVLTKALKVHIISCDGWIWLLRFFILILSLTEPFRIVFLGTPKIVKPEKPIDSEVIPCLLA